MKNILSTFIILTSVFIFFSCEKENEESGPVRKTNISGFLEKGPFVNGSKVTIYELDNQFLATGKTFESTTDKLGHFELRTSIELVSKYVKLSANGYYFNEVTGELSQAPISLDAIVDISNKDNINVNLLTHLEMKRVLYLVEKENKSFSKAKEQANSELLNCFLIKDKTIIPEQACITGNDLQANVLIAISSILLRDKTDAQFTELINNFSDDFEKDGLINEDLKEIIKKSSHNLNYISVKNNIVDRYAELGKEITVGNFHYFIDGDNDGELSDTDYPIDGPIISEGYFKDKDAYISAFGGVLLSMHNNIQNFYAFDATFTKTVNPERYNNSYQDFYTHNLTAGNQAVSEMWRMSYQAIRRINFIFENAESEKTELGIFKYPAMVYRAYVYTNMIEGWGDVAFVTKTASDGSNMFPPRTNKIEILNYLANELIEAEKQLPPQLTDYVVCSKDVATVTLAKIYLELENYDGVLDCTSKIINNGKYTLSNDYNSIFNGDSPENIFYFLAKKGVVDKYNLFFEENLRKGDYIPLIRYAETLLIAAEANLKKGNNNEAIRLLNLVIDRNKRTKLDNTATQSAIINALLNEWKMDFAKEGKWFNALKRFNLAEETLNMKSPHMKLLPIPSSELSVNPSMTQNPGYGY